ncbi:MAG: DNA-3-methyladenine glycosylase [Acidobacteria bacterium]|nr:DNA-3-methyladenine glycosylase [Acidobacteriota bacterium]MBI3656948.1 DNA-3-methyladenine glycosylase [Acidobacteriota bacterium]
MPLPRSFYSGHTLRVAEKLLGQLLVHNSAEGEIAGRIVEAEAYIGEDDPACHAAKGYTPRTAIMYGEPGHAYVYFTYGMHYMFNVVTERKGFPGAVLIRAVEPIKGIEIMARHRRRVTDPKNLANGPAKLCQAFRIDRHLNGVDLCRSVLYVERLSQKGHTSKILWTPRIGISDGLDRHWRCCLAENPYVSHYRP